MAASPLPLLQYCPPAPADVHLEVLCRQLLSCSPSSSLPTLAHPFWPASLFPLSCWDGCNPWRNVAHRLLQDLGVWLWRASHGECKAGKSKSHVTWQHREGRAGGLWAVQCAWLASQLIRQKIEARLSGCMCHFPIHCVWVMYSLPVVLINISHSFFLLQFPLG